MIVIFRLTAATLSGFLVASAYHGAAGIQARSVATSKALSISQASAMPQLSRTVWDGVYTEEQATRGKQVYEQLCSSCHRSDLSGGDASRPLKGQPFFDRWHDRSLFDLSAIIQSFMPHDYHVFVPADSARDIVAFLLHENGIPAGNEALSPIGQQLAIIRITRPR
jgi:S-disulfanyl-L-cysteine oxidoreductase SoxD